MAPDRKRDVGYKSMVDDVRIRHTKTCAQAVIMAYGAIKFLGGNHLGWVSLFVRMTVLAMVWTFIAFMYEKIYKLPETWWGELGRYLAYGATGGMYVILLLHVYGRDSPFAGFSLPPFHVIV